MVNVLISNELFDKIEEHVERVADDDDQPETQSRRVHVWIAYALASSLEDGTLLQEEWLRILAGPDPDNLGTLKPEGNVMNIKPGSKGYIYGGRLSPGNLGNLGGIMETNSLDHPVAVDSQSSNKITAGKAPMGLLPPRSLTQTAWAMDNGALKYGVGDWIHNSYTTVYEAAMRHLLAWFGGEDNDPGSGLSHWAHVAANAMMAMAIEEKGTKDDRP